MEENLYDEFGNYVGPEAEDDEDEEDEDWLGGMDGDEDFRKT